MNTILVTALLLNISSNKILIQKYQSVPEMDYQMVLTVPTPDKRVFLDCQSFINAIYYQSSVNGEWKDDWSMMVSGSQCEEVSQYAIESLDAGKLFCLNVDLKKREVDMSSNIEECNDLSFKSIL